MSIAYPLRIFFDCSTAHRTGEGRAYLEEIAGRVSGQVEPWSASTPYAGSFTRTRPAIRLFRPILPKSCTRPRSGR